jgi:dihydrofolate reductase
VLEVFGEVDRGHAPAPELALDPKAVGERRGKALRHSRQEYPAAGFERFHVVKTIPGSTDRDLVKAGLAPPPGNGRTNQQGHVGAGLAPARLAGDLARAPALRSLAAGLHIESQARPPQRLRVGMSIWRSLDRRDFGDQARRDDPVGQTGQRRSIMRKLIVTTFLSLDGVMQAPGGPEEDREGGFEHGGWLVPYADEDLGRIVTAWIEEADGFLLGRKTYNIFAAHWPRITDPADRVARALNSRPKYVASRTLDKAEWNNSAVIKANVAEEVAKLKRQPGKELQVHGSGDLAQTLIKNDLIDEYRLWFFPVVLGTGKRLFAAGSLSAALKLLDTKTTSTGVLVNTYVRVGKPRYGSFALDQ